MSCEVDCQKSLLLCISAGTRLLILIYLSIHNSPKDYYKFSHGSLLDENLNFQNRPQ